VRTSTTSCPDGYDTVGWALVFLVSLALIAYWGSTDEEAREELDERIEDIRAEHDDEATP